MNIAVLGTGVVGQTIGGKLLELGHNVRMGSRTASNEKANEWAQKSGANASVGTFEDAAKFGEIVFVCTSGMGTLDALRQAGTDNLANKIVVDITNPLDFSNGFPPSLFVSNTDSLGEQIQREFPEAKVVKTLNTISANVMVQPSLVPGTHDVFMGGNDAAAKASVKDILTNWFGWNSVIDIGDITTARATEQVLPLWVRLYGAFRTPNFNIHIVRDKA